MSRTTAISVLLLIAAAILAIALFVAGAVWRGRQHTAESLGLHSSSAGAAETILKTLVSSRLPLAGVPPDYPP